MCNSIIVWFVFYLRHCQRPAVNKAHLGFMLYISSGQILCHYIWQLFLYYVIISVILGESVVLPMNWQSGIWGIKTEERMCVCVCVCVWERERERERERSSVCFGGRDDMHILIFRVVVQPLSSVRLFATPWTAAPQASLSFTISPSLLKLISIESVMPSNHLHLLSSPSSPAFSLSQH